MEIAGHRGHNRSLMFLENVGCWDIRTRTQDGLVDKFVPFADQRNLLHEGAGVPFNIEAKVRIAPNLVRHCFQL